MMPSTTILPYLVADFTSPPPFVDRTYGEPRFHTESPVQSLSYDSDDTLWSIEEAGVLRQWSRDGRLLSRSFLAELQSGWCFNADATKLASSSNDLAIWDISSARVLHRIPTDSWVESMAFSPDGKILASGHEDGTIRLWDVASGKKVGQWQAHEKEISAIAFRDQKGHLATAGEDKLIHVWDLASKKRLHSFKGHSDRIPSLSWQSGSDVLISAGWDTTARVWELPKSDPLMLLNSHSDQVHFLAHSSDGKQVAVADSDFAIHVWNDPQHGKVQFVLHGHTNEVRALAFSRDGSRLASAGDDCVVHLWDMNAGQLVAGPNPRARHGITLVAERQIVSTAGTTLQAWEQESAKPTWVPEGESILSIAASPDGKRLATGGQSPVVKIWDLAKQTLETTLNHTRGPIINLTFSADSQLLASASITDGLAWVWRMGTPEAICVIPEAAESSTLETIAFHPKLNWLAVGGIDWLATGGSDGALCLWSIDQLEKITSVPVGVTSIAFDPSGRYIAAGTLKQTVAVWEVKDLSKVFDFSGHQDRVGAVLFSPDGSWLVSASDDSTIRIWNMLTGRLAIARQFDAAIQSLAFSKDGKYLYTGNGNSTCYRLELKKLFED